MEENQKKLEATLEMFKPFLEGNNLSTEMSDYLETVYYVPREKMSFYIRKTNTSNVFDDSKIFPISAHNTEGFYVAEFWFPYLEGGIKKGNFFMISHVFKLDIQQIEAGLNNLHDADKNRFKILLKPENIAYVIQEHYKENKPSLLKENGVENYNILAEILYKNWSKIVFDL